MSEASVNSDSARLQGALAPVLVYAEAFASGRRVGVVGRGAIVFADAFARMGARHVVAFDADTAEAYELRTPAPMTVRPLRDVEGALRPGALDFLLLLDVQDVLPLSRFLPFARRLLSTQGCLLAVAQRLAPEMPGGLDAPAGAPSYEELYDVFALQFEQVRMLGVLPFQAAAVVEFGATDPAVSVDTQLVTESAQPVQYIVCASAEVLDIDSYMLVQLPATAHAIVANAGAPLQVAEPQGLDEVRSTHAAALAEIERMHAETMHKSETAQIDLTAQRTEATRRIRELESALATALERVESAELRVRTHGMEATALTVEMERMRSERKDQVREIRELRALLEAPRAQLTPPVPPAELAQAHARAEAAEQALTQLRSEYAQQQSVQVQQESAHGQQQREHVRNLADLNARLADQARAAIGYAKRVDEHQAKLSVQSAAFAALEQRLAVQAKTLLEQGQAAEAYMIEKAEMMARAELGSQALEAEAQLAFELSALESKLQSVARSCSEKDRELDKRGRIVAELVLLRELEGPGSNGALGPTSDGFGLSDNSGGDLSLKLDALARSLCVAQGELEARGWRIQELERSLQMRSS
jgi:hypothetical protein